MTVAADQIVPPERQVFCNRTLNLRSIHAVGYDMDYTLVHYFSDEWERAAFEHARSLLAKRGWPVETLVFDPDAVSQGLAFDITLGNLLKATRFGYVIRAQHGRRALSYSEIRTTYSGTIVDLAEDRFDFANTLFSLSQASLYSQLVDLVDQQLIPEAMGYRDLWRVVDEVLAESHAQGELKSKIIADPSRFVDLDHDLVLTLLDQKAAGKTLLLVTNSEWSYTRAMMAYAVDRFLPPGPDGAAQTWRDLFDLVIVQAAKPSFFDGTRVAYEVVDEERGWLEPHRGLLQRGRAYVGGSAQLVEASLGLSGSELLYVGDHLFGDVHVSKAMLRWRTCLILRELEDEVRELSEFVETEHELAVLMRQKTAIDRQLARLRLARLRARRAYGPTLDSADAKEIDSAIRRATDESVALDTLVAPLARAAGMIGNAAWGPLMRAGNDKSLFARQVERYADIYTSRVSNLMAETPFAYLRAARTSLPHDPDR